MMRILLRNAGYGVLWALSMSLFIYAGSMQYVGVGLLTGGATVITTAITTIMVNCRHLFYGISMIEKKKAMTAAILIGVMAVATMLLRFLPFKDDKAK